MRIRKRLVVIAGLACALGFAAVASDQNEAKQLPVATKALKNGMKVLVQSDHSIPNVALYIFYRIGSRNEHPGTTGLSIFFFQAEDGIRDYKVTGVQTCALPI